MTLSKDFESRTSPWFDIGKFNKWLKDMGIDVDHGERHNQTDGEVHYILKRGMDVFALHANYWDYRSPGWQEAINWTEILKEGK